MTTPQRAVTEPVIQVSQGAARQSALVGWLLSGCLHLIAIVLLLLSFKDKVLNALVSAMVLKVHPVS